MKSLNEVSKHELASVLATIDTVLTDCDGVLWQGSNVIKNAPETIQLLRKIGKKVIYVTNNSSKTRTDYLKKVTNLGFGGEYVSFNIVESEI